MGVCSKYLPSWSLLSGCRPVSSRADGFQMRVLAIATNVSKFTLRDRTNRFIEIVAWWKAIKIHNRATSDLQLQSKVFRHRFFYWEVTNEAGTIRDGVWTNSIHGAAVDVKGASRKSRGGGRIIEDPWLVWALIPELVRVFSKFDIYDSSPLTVFERIITAWMSCLLALADAAEGGETGQ